MPGVKSVPPSKGGFRRRDTARGHPSNPPSRSSATPKPPLYNLPLCAKGTPFTHPPSWFFQGHSFAKDNNIIIGTAICFFKENMHFR